MNIVDIFSQLILCVFSMTAITNPFGNLPIFMSMSGDLHEKQRARLFRLIVYVAAIIILVFAVIGTVVMEKFFQVNISQLRIAGGILLICMGVKNILFPQVNKKDNANDNSVSDDEVNQRIIPMAFPMLVGPGALATVIVLENEYGYIMTFAAVIINFTFIFLLFAAAKYIERLLGKITLFVLSRIMQMFIMAVGVKMLTTGIKSVFGI